RYFRSSQYSWEQLPQQEGCRGLSKSELSGATQLRQLDGGLIPQEMDSSCRGCAVQLLHARLESCVGKPLRPPPSLLSYLPGPRGSRADSSRAQNPSPGALGKQGCSTSDWAAS